MGEITKSDPMSTGRKIWLWTAIVISVIVLILAAGGVVGTWVVRGVAIDLNNGLMDGVIRLAGAGGEAVNRLEGRVNNLSSAVGEIEAAVDEVAANITDKGLVLTLLPPEKEQELVSTAEQIGETVSTITASIEAASDLYKSIDNIPFVDLPKPKEETVQELDSGIQEMQASVDQLATDIQDFRDGAASGVSKISSAAGDVNDRLQTSQNNLSEVQVELSGLQTSAEEFKGTFKTTVTILTIVLSLLMIWVVYGMVIVILQSWKELKA